MATAVSLPVPSILRRFRYLAVTLVALAFFAAPLSAHMLNITRLSVTVADHSAELRIEADLTLLLDGSEAYDELIHNTPEQQAARLPALAAEVLADIPVTLAPATTAWEYASGELPPDRDDDPNANPDFLGMTTFVFRTALPGDADYQVTFSSQALARVEFPLAYSLVLPATQSTLTRWLELPGTTSQPLTIPAAALRPAVSPPVQAAAAPDPSGKNTATEATPPPAEIDPRAYHSDAPWHETVWQYLRLGFRHILPLGLDHILFVLGLYFLGAGWRALAAQITCFTIAHTTTLGLAAYGLVRVPAGIVEPLIALSIAFVALENIFRPRLGAGRLVVVFLFGLLHGLGFAGSLSDVPMPRNQFFTALLSFNFGVDFGQLAVLTAAFLTAGWFRDRPWYRRTITIPACAAIAATGLFWTIQRSIS